MPFEHHSPDGNLQTTAHAVSSAGDVLAPTAGQLLHRPARTGEMYWGPGDLYTFLVTGAESGGAYFAMEALVPRGGGPPPHIHRNEDETFYVVEGDVEFSSATGSPSRPRATS